MSVTIEKAIRLLEDSVSCVASMGKSGDSNGANACLVVTAVNHNTLAVVEAKHEILEQLKIIVTLLAASDVINPPPRDRQ